MHGNRSGRTGRYFAPSGQNRPASIHSARGGQVELEVCSASVSVVGRVSREIKATSEKTKKVS